MFEEENDQNGTQSNNSSAVGRYGFNFTPTALDDGTMADQILSGKMFAAPHVSAANNSDFVNQGALQIDPDQGNGDPQFGLPATSTPRASQSPYQPPINPRDDQGKTLPKYRMGVGQRILGTVTNFLNGFARNGAAPVYVGSGALNNRYYQDEGLRQQRNEENSSNVIPDSNIGTAPQDDGSAGTTTNLGLNTNAFSFQRNTPARNRWRTILNPQQPAKGPYTYTAVHRRTGQRIGSNDGVNWSNTGNSDSKPF